MRTPLAIAISTIIGLASWATHRQADTNLIGKLPDGSTRVVTGWKIKPAGTSILLPDMLQRAALAPDGKTLAVISGGAGVHELHLIEPTNGTLRQASPSDAHNPSVLLGQPIAKPSSSPVATADASTVSVFPMTSVVQTRMRSPSRVR